MKSKLQKKAEAELKKLRLLLKKVANGKKIPDENQGNFFLEDLSELIRYYQYVSKNKLIKANQFQADMDTATRDLIRCDVFEEIDLFSFQHQVRIINPKRVKYV